MFFLGVEQQKQTYLQQRESNLSKNKLISRNVIAMAHNLKQVGMMQYVFQLVTNLMGMLDLLQGCPNNSDSDLL